MSIDKVLNTYAIKKRSIVTKLSKKNVTGCDEKIAFKPQSHPQLPVGTNCTFLTLVPRFLCSFLTGCTWTRSIPYTSWTNSFRLLSMFSRRASRNSFFKAGFITLLLLLWNKRFDLKEENSINDQENKKIMKLYVTNVR